MKVVGYSDRFSVQPGETIKFMVSCEEQSYRAEVVRLIHGDDNRKGPGFKEEAVGAIPKASHKGRVQRLYRGSYAETAEHPLLRCETGFTIAAWVQPATPEKGVQGLVTRWSAEQGGYGLFIDEDGSAAVWVGKGKRTGKLKTGVAMRRPEWYFVAATYDAASGKASVRQMPASSWPIDPSKATAEGTLGPGAPRDAGGPLLMAAHAAAGKPGVAGHYNGKLEAPALFGRVLSAEEIEALRNGVSPHKLGSGLVGAWDFSRDISSVRISDTGPHRLHGRAAQMPTRASTGHNWMGQHVDFTAAPEEYGAIHFHDDDLEDAGWDVDFELVVPDTLRSGVYAAKLATRGGEDYVPFFVRPKRGTATAPVAFLAPTLSYIAYANEHQMEQPFVIELLGLDAGMYPKQEQDKYIVENRLMSLYDYHSDGSGVAYSSRLRPIVNMRPKYVMQALSLGNGAPHQFNADLHLVDWMEAKGHRYDVITDEDLHFEGTDLLTPYKVVVTGSHPEYWSGQMLDALEAYLAEGGRIMYLGGNGFYWVTTLHPEAPHVAEVRRWRGSQAWQAAPGEYYNSTTGELGGLWRFRGRPPQKMLGVGFTAQGSDRNAPYRRQPDSFDPRAKFIFEGIGKNEVIGDFPSLVMEHGAGGFELDRLDFELGTPGHALLLATSTGYSDVYQHVAEEVLASDGRQGGSTHPLVKSDIVYFEGPKGGAVFSVGSISWCGSLSYNNYDNNVSRMTDNVLRRFASV